MAILTGVFATFQATGNREDLTNLIDNISPREAPMYDAMGTVACSNAASHEWQIDTLATATANAQTEGKLFGATAITPTNRLTNRTQIFTKEFTISDTQELVAKAGRSKESAYQMVNKMAELKRDFEWAIWDDGVSSTGTAGGLGTAAMLKNAHAWISATNNTGVLTGAATTSTMTEANFNTLLQDIWNLGGKPNAVHVHGTQKRLISGWGTSTSRVWDGSRKITNTIDVYESDFGVLECKLNRYVAGANSKTGYVVDESRFKKAVLKPVGWKPLADRGLGTDYMLWTQWTLESRNASGSGKFWTSG